MSRQEPVATTNVLVADDGWCSTCTVCGLAGNIMLCEFGCADADSRAVCSLAYHPACLGLSKAPKEQFVCPRHGRLSTIPARRLPQKVLALALSCCIVLMRCLGVELHLAVRSEGGREQEWPTQEVETGASGAHDSAAGSWLGDNPARFCR